MKVLLSTAHKPPSAAPEKRGVRRTWLRLASLLCASSSIVVIAASAAAIQSPPTSAPGQSWTDRGEYDAVLAVRSETSPAARIALLDQWKAKYPNSALRDARRELYLAAYREENDSAKMLPVAEEMAADDPGNVVGLYWTALLIPTVASPDSAALQLAAKAAHGMIANRDKFYSSTARPQGISDADWTTQAQKFEFVAHRALGWTSWQTKDLTDAEAELTSALKLAPDDAQVESWLATVQTLEGTPKAQSAAVWHLLRAGGAEGEHALPNTERTQFGTAAKRLYIAENGDESGLDDLKMKSAAAAFPPDNFEISPLAGASATDSAVNASIWPRLRARLTAPDGQTYFDQNVKGKALPLMKAKVVRCTPAGKPKEVALALADDMQEDVILTLSAPLASSAKPGTEVEFSGTADSFSPAPFHITAMADPDNLTGWPEANRTKSTRAAH